MKVLNKKVLEVEGNKYPIPDSAIGFYINNDGENYWWYWIDSLSFLRISDKGGFSRSTGSQFIGTENFSDMPYPNPTHKSITLLNDLEQVEFVENTYKVGDRVVVEGIEYIIAAVEGNRVILINIATGYRKANSVHVKGYKMITESDLSKMLGLD